MFNVFKLLVRPGSRRSLGLGFVIAMLSLPAWSQTTNTVTLSSPSVTQLATFLGQTTSTNSTLLINCTFNGTLSVSEPLFVTGNTIITSTTNFNVVFTGSGGVRMFQVQPGVTFTVNNLTLSGGQSIGRNGNNGNPGTTSSGSKGGTGGNGDTGSNGFGGAIYNQGNTFAINCIFLTNNATGGNGGTGGPGGNAPSNIPGTGGTGGNGGYGLGGAIFNGGMLVVTNCTFAGNVAIGGTGGVGGAAGTGLYAAPSGAGGSGALAAGAGIYNIGRMSIQACTFLDNVAAGGNSQAQAVQTSGVGSVGFAGGFAEGGAIYNLGTNAIVVNCTFATNQTVGGIGGAGGGANGGTAGRGGNGGNSYGGSVYNAQSLNSNTNGALAITNCTFVGGSVVPGTNGGFGSVGATNNNPGTIGQYGGANIANYTTTTGNTNFILANSILAYITNGFNSYGTISNAGYNLSSDATPNTFTSRGSITNIDPMLYTLTTNGGPTLTYQPVRIGPEVGAIPVGVAVPLFDQRGSPRFTTNVNDIGAVEFAIPAYTIEGFITGENASNYLNMFIQAVSGTSGQSFTVSPISTGEYVFALPADTYTIIPQATNGFNFVPISTIVTVESDIPAVSNINFAATSVYNIGGTISNAASAVTVDLFINGNFVASTVSSTASNNLYVFTNVAAGSYTVVPRASTTYSFLPASQVTNVPTVLSNGYATNLNFFAVAPYFSVSGNIAGGPPVVTVIATGPSGSVTNQSTNGAYTSTPLFAGTYTITPQPTNGYTFTPQSLPENVGPSTNNQNFTANAPTSTFSLSGKIANVTSPVGILASNSSFAGTVLSDASGNYSFPSLAAGTYTLYPQPTNGYVSFSPASATTNVQANVTGENFTANAGFSLAGQITNYHAAVSFSAKIGATTYATNTDTNGIFAFTNLPTGSYVVTPPTVNGLTFSPTSISTNLTASINGLIFAALPSQRPTNSSVLLTNGTLQFSIDGVPNITYRIQDSTNLAGSNWLTISTNTADASGVLNISLPASNGSNLFFRAVTP